MAAYETKKQDILDREVLALAELAIGRYGERAPAYASLQALKARYQRKLNETEAWQRIANSVMAILRSEPSWDQRVAHSRAATGGEHEFSRGSADRAHRDEPHPDARPVRVPSRAMI
jgi:hypothetical protein